MGKDKNRNVPPINNTGKCPNCGGSGTKKLYDPKEKRYFDSDCTRCGGTGEVQFK